MEYAGLTKSRIQIVRKNVTNEKMTATIFHHQVPVGEEATVNFKLNNSSSSLHHRFA